MAIVLTGVKYYPLFPTVSIVVTVVGCLLTILVIWTRPALRKLVNAPLVSLGCADILFVTLYSPSWIQQILNPQWEPPPALCWLNHVRKSKKRVQAQGPSVSRLTVQHTRGEGGSTSGAGPSTSIETGKVVKPVRILEGVMWVGDEKFTLRNDGQKGNDHIKQSKPKDAMILVAPAPGTGIDEQGKTYLSGDEKQKGNDLTEPDVAQGMTLTVATVSGQTGKTERQQHAVPGSSSQSCTSPAERQITKMMMMLFVVYTLCCMPMTLMVIFSSKVPAEAFTVGQLLALLNGALNPVVYGVMNKNIRQGYKHIWDRVLNFIT
uniref:G-protein coupled receptors family 1 profile domain-containing protein n=1 Tax=Branchiostoma floridae TaxID=7739 RepID=C3ZFI4_BRAFL|eukprot:XP_002592727.1 hypothetical protein BRAFLDRAFT_67167 [Branchiostoma floridae]